MTEMLVNPAEEESMLQEIDRVCEAMLLDLARGLVDRLAPAEVVGHDMRLRVLMAQGCIEGILDADDAEADMITDVMLESLIEDYTMVDSEGSEDLYPDSEDEN